jgi:hypothetical protein
MTLAEAFGTGLCAWFDVGGVGTVTELWKREVAAVRMRSLCFGATQLLAAKAKRWALARRRIVMIRDRTKGTMNVVLQVKIYG